MIMFTLRVGTDENRHAVSVEFSVDDDTKQVRIHMIDVYGFEFYLWTDDISEIVIEVNNIKELAGEED
jgi:hypothetical protein